MKIKTFHINLVSLSAFLIKAMGNTSEVLRICRDSVTMATIYVVMFGKTVYEYSQCVCVNMQRNVNIR